MTLRHLVLVATACLALATCAAAATTLQAMTHVNCTGGDVITLRVKETRVTVAGKVTFTTRLYALNDGAAAFPGPVIHMKAGEQCNVDVVNELTGNAAQASCPSHSNTFHCPDTTVLHTHGLHVSPDEDNINTYVLPGQTLRYTYNVPSNHLMGTHWYHAHRHGSTFLQVVGGMAGVLLVDPADDYVATLPDSHQMLYMDSHRNSLLFLAHHFFGASDGGGGGFALRNYQDISGAFSDQSIDPNVNILDAANADFYSVNGQFAPEIDVGVAEVYLLRMVHAAGTRVLRLVPTFTDVTCTITLMARDGVFQYVPLQEVTELVFVQGTRADYAVRCEGTTSPPTANAGITFAATPSTDANYALGTDNQHTQAVVFKINIIERDLGLGVGGINFAAPLPSYLTSLDSATPESTVAITLGGGQVNNALFPGYEAPVATRYQANLCVNKMYQFDLNVPAARRLTANGLDVAGASPTLRAGSGRALLQGPGGPGGPGGGGGGGNGPAHPYHQHVNHFQVTNLNGRTWPVDIMRLNEWRDVVPAAAVSMRFPTDSFAGEIILHCHILEHEDEGMMALYNIADCCSVDGDCLLAPSECQLSTCNTTLGVCEYPNKADGTACSIGTCQAGTCKCASNAHCDDGKNCTTDTCDVGSGVCTNAVLPVNSSCTIGGSAGVCNATGSCLACLWDSDCDDNVECTTDTCTNGECVNTQKAARTPCTDPVGGFCSPTATCVLCYQNNHCNEHCGAGTCTSDVCVSPTTFTQNTTCNTGVGTGYCDGSDRETCHTCLYDFHCVPSNQCQFGTCTGNSCVYADSPAGTNCSLGTCDGAGGCSDGVAPTASELAFSQTGAAAGTISGKCNKAGTVHCVAWRSANASGAIAGPGYDAAGVISAGVTSAVADAATAFSLSASGISMPAGTTAVKVSCVCTDSGNVIGAVFDSTDQAVDTAAPVITGLTVTLSGSTATFTGTVDEAATMYIHAENSGNGIPTAATITAYARTISKASAGSFTGTMNIEQDEDAFIGFVVARDQYNFESGVFYSDPVTITTGCSDGLKNGEETDVDCYSSNGCQLCSAGKQCVDGGNCESGTVCADDAASGLRLCTNSSSAEAGEYAAMNITLQGILDASDIRADVHAAIISAYAAATGASAAFIRSVTTTDAGVKVLIEARIESGAAMDCTSALAAATTLVSSTFISDVNAAAGSNFAARTTSASVDASACETRSAVDLVTYAAPDTGGDSGFDDDSFDATEIVVPVAAGLVGLCVLGGIIGAIVMCCSKATKPGKTSPAVPAQ